MSEDVPDAGMNSNRVSLYHVGSGATRSTLQVRCIGVAVVALALAMKHRSFHPSTSRVPGVKPSMSSAHLAMRSFASAMCDASANARLPDSLRSVPSKPADVYVRSHPRASDVTRSIPFLPDTSYTVPSEVV